MKTGGRLIKHACYYWRLLAESHLTRRLFGSMLWRIVALPLPAGLPKFGWASKSVRREARDGPVSEVSAATSGRFEFRIDPLPK